MLNERVKNFLQYLAWLFFFLFLLYAGTVAVVARAAKPYSQQKEKVAKLVKQTSMKQIDKYYHLSRGVKSYSASGKTSKGKAAYFIYLPGKHKAYYYSASDGVSESTVKSSFQKSYPKKGHQGSQPGLVSKAGRLGSHGSQRRRQLLLCHLQVQGWPAPVSGR